MLGQVGSPGIMDLTLNEVFDEIEKINMYKDSIIKVSYLEVYNETIKDLLSSNDTNLDLREDPIKGICISGLGEFEVKTKNIVMNLIKYNIAFSLIY